MPVRSSNKQAFAASRTSPVGTRKYSRLDCQLTLRPVQGLLIIHPRRPHELIQVVNKPFGGVYFPSNRLCRMPPAHQRMKIRISCHYRGRVESFFTTIDCARCEDDRKTLLRMWKIAASVETVMK